MCICCCCCCNCFNSFSSKCIELSIFILSSFTFISSILEISIIKWNHLTSTTFTLLIILVIFSAIMTISSMAILFYRFKKIINKKRNSMGICLARIGLFISITSFFISIIAESMIQSNFNEIDHPCKNYNNQIQNDDVIYFRNIRILSDDKNQELCKDKNNNYDAKICSNLEYAISYLSATIIEMFTLLLIFLWLNDLRRIKEKVDNMLTLYGDSSYLSKNKYIGKKNMNFKERDENHNNGINEFDSVNRYFNQHQNNSIQSQVILIKNNRNNKVRLSQSINLNFKKSSKPNYIDNIRKEMKEGIESINEEESSENKDNDNDSYNSNKKSKDISIYGSGHIKNNQKRENNNYKNEIEGINTNIEEEKEENSNELPDLYIPNE